MAIEVAIDSTIGRPPDEVFAAVADLERWPAWLIASGIRSVRRGRQGAPVPEERLIVVQDAAGRAGTFDAQVTAYEDGRRLALSGRDGDGVSIDIEALVEPIPDSDARATELHWSIRIALPIRYRVLESMARPQVERAALLDIEGLRLRLESRSGD